MGGGVFCGVEGWCWVEDLVVGRVGVGVRGLLGCPAVLLVRVPGSAWCSGCGAEMVAAVERVDELFGPWPAGCDAESGLSAATCDLARGVEQGVAEPFWFGSGEVTVHA